MVLCVANPIEVDSIVKAVRENCIQFPYPIFFAFSKFIYVVVEFDWFDDHIVDVVVFGKV